VDDDDNDGGGRARATSYNTAPRIHFSVVATARLTRRTKKGHL
jgi:hypothetical protein